MTGVIEAPGIGHNQPDPYEMEKKNQKWDRWAKKRTFVRALEGTYSHLYKALVEEKRVYSSSDIPRPKNTLLIYATSNSPAAPMPPPMHIVATTYRAPRRLPSMSACPTRRAPDMP